MRIEINTNEKTIKIIDSLDVDELIKFVDKFKLHDYSIISDNTFTYYPYPYYPSYPSYPYKWGTIEVTYTTNTQDILGLNK